MSTVNWLLFSYTLPAKLPGGRVKVWRKLSTIGAVQLKGGIYVLPESEANLEHLEWTSREVEELGGEALLVLSPTIAHLPDEDIKAIFGRARDEDYDRLEGEMRSLVVEERDLKGALRKFTRRFEAIKEIDFFPTGRGERAARLLDEMAEKLTGPKQASARARLDKSGYAEKVWVTRERPYVDRLASFWLVRRFIDPEARLAFLGSKERIERDGEKVFFDMTGGDFTHQDGLITFEAMIAAFGLEDSGLARLSAIIRAIDLKEEDGNEEARAIRDVIDGLVLLAKNDFDLVDKALVVLDALHVVYSRQKGEAR